MNPWLFGNHPMMPPPVPNGYRWSLPLLYLVFAIVVALLYVACRWFARWKARRQGAWHVAGAFVRQAAAKSSAAIVGPPRFSAFATQEDRRASEYGSHERPSLSRHRYQDFRQDYRQQRLDDAAESGSRPEAESPDRRRGKRREYLREYLRWLWPHRYAVAAVFVLALLTAGLEMIEPLFMRFIIDRVLLNTALDTAARARAPESGGPRVPRRDHRSPT